MQSRLFYKLRGLIRSHQAQEASIVGSLIQLSALPSAYVLWYDSMKTTCLDMSISKEMAPSRATGFDTGETMRRDHLVSAEISESIDRCSSARRGRWSESHRESREETIVETSENLRNVLCRWVAFQMRARMFKGEPPLNQEWLYSERTQR